MFDTYVLDRRTSPRFRWLASAAILAVTVVAAALVGLIIYSYWKIDRLTPKYRSISFLPSITPPAPPPPAAAPPPVRSTKRPDTPRRVAVVPVQPADEPPPVDPDTTPADPDDGAADGSPNGVPGGTDPNGTGTDPNGLPGGDPNAPPCATCEPIPTPPSIEKQKESPRVVPIDAIQGQRTAGREKIPLPRAVVHKANQEGNRRLFVAVQLCLDTAGVPDRIELVKSSGYPEADEEILSELGRWRYRPYSVNGRPVAVCTAVTFQYIIED